MNVRRRAIAAALAVIVLTTTAGCGSSAGGGKLQGTLQRPTTRKPEFTLTDTEGRPFDFQKQTAGRMTFLYFGYTNCPDICQIRMAQMAAVEARPHVPKVTVVFVTVDPARDTTAVLGRWLAHFHASFIGLTGSPQKIEAAEEASGVPPATRQPGTEPGQYFMSHPADMQAYAPNGVGYTTYPYGTTIDAFVNDIKILVKRTQPAG